MTAPIPASSDNVRVAIRVRPVNRREKALGCQNILTVNNDGNMITINRSDLDPSKSKSFTYDYVYDDTAPQQLLYEDIAFPLVEAVLEGYNGTVFAYGQTGCGKTYTMEVINQTSRKSKQQQQHNTHANIPNKEDRGIIPNAFDHIFDRIDTEKQTKFLIRVGYIEIYNEEIRDLFADRVYVENLCMATVTTSAEAQRLMNKGRSTRVVAYTDMNAESSRSHTIFFVYVETSHIDENSKEEKIKAGKLNLVDLAGSERQVKTQTTGLRLKEATKINLSLSALGNVISALVEGKGKHIPYRDSKLTRLLQDSLGGNTKTIMIACVSPSAESYDETLSTLRYANRAKNIKNKPRINEDPKDALLKQYQEEIHKLKEMLQNNSHYPHGPNNSTLPSNDQNKETARVQHEHNELTSKLQRMKQEQLQSEEIRSQLEQEKCNLQVLSKEKGERGRTNNFSKVNKKKDKKSQSWNEKKKMEEEMMEQLYLLESQLLEGGHDVSRGESKLNEMKKHREVRRQAKQSHQHSATSNANEDTKNKLKENNKHNHKDRMVAELEKNLASAHQEIDDLHGEFERARQDLLDNIRCQYQELNLYKQLTQKLFIKQNVSERNDENEQWILPEFMACYKKNQSRYANANYNQHQSGRDCKRLQQEGPHAMKKAMLTLVDSNNPMSEISGLQRLMQETGHDEFKKNNCKPKAKNFADQILLETTSKKLGITNKQHIIVEDEPQKDDAQGMRAMIQAEQEMSKLQSKNCLKTNFAFMYSFSEQKKIAYKIRAKKTNQITTTHKLFLKIKNQIKFLF
ncbi:hypothetical protein RFI_15811 [Reticulomyxa filosa]|uniref:Kinesin-like protein n=1 Tax=Reticulomyxa filosa TaxID=46433 RepID=X6N664_RETFI|nr:hypothetical protein RFI_15811 [Reticulomyxa filosa]|eukprot:ETO21393.1 hypothetical protein RFI_15811 [Reticulomyxa filosa]